MSILAIAVEILKTIEKYVNKNIKCEHGYAYSHFMFSLTYFSKISEFLPL